MDKIKRLIKKSEDIKEKIMRLEFLLEEVEQAIVAAEREATNA